MHRTNDAFYWATVIVDMIVRGDFFGGCRVPAPFTSAVMASASLPGCWTVLSDGKGLSRIGRITVFVLALGDRNLNCGSAHIRHPGIPTNVTSDSLTY